MEISWLGHSCVHIRSKDVTLITDPYDKTLGLSMGRQEADIVTMSHLHPHHSNHDGIGGNPKVLQSPGEYEIASFYISGMGTDRSDDEAERRTNTIFAIHCEGLMLCHLGDLNRGLSSRQIDELGHTDILFVPAGGVCTLSTARVAELVNMLGPKIVVPLHYHTEGVKVEIQPLDAFLEDMGVSEPTHQSRLSVTSSNLPRETTLVVLDRVP